MVSHPTAASVPIAGQSTFVSGGRLYCTADDGRTGTELWSEGVCAGDCDGDGAVRIDELVRGVRIALGTDAVAVCAVFDRNGDGAVAIDELVAAVGSALADCG